MKVAIVCGVLLGFLLQLGTATQEPDVPKLEQKLLGNWKGPACGGDYTFKADRTFVLDSFTPGGNTLTGSWSIR